MPFFSNYREKLVSCTIYFSLCITFIIFFLVSTSYSEELKKTEPTISNVSISEKSGKLYLSFTLENGIPNNILQVIKSGITVKYTYSVVLKQKGTLWDSELIQKNIYKKIRFDNLQNRYLIIQELPSNRIISTKNIDQAKKYLLNVKSIKLLKLKNLVKNKLYKIEIKAKCEKEEKSSIPFSKLVRVFSSFGFSTETYEFEFIY